ncbi:biotin transporter BioY [Salipiger mangrovisoli]|uniref:Biotin transporter n=1 Tax=Salipiger mangrovisoli TaxID=2865933 RepID=A0ABR9X5B8_9RHOB|nr:biotin transporter BioY [Salipiger mangrovisoli]MBE9638738.1 biotin transporter BioY [Salipiger mangrovisoli]
MTPLTPTHAHGLPLWRSLVLALAGAALITIGAKVQIPFWPVPMTLHTLAIFLVAAGLGPRLGLAAMMTYLGAGALGLPVFSGTPERGIGLAYMAGPTGGYLAGYLLATPLIGTLAQGRGWLGMASAMIAGLALVYAVGLAWLALFVSAPKLLGTGLTPFVLADLLKVALAATLVSAADRLKGRFA